MQTFAETHASSEVSEDGSPRLPGSLLAYSSIPVKQSGLRKPMS